MSAPSLQVDDLDNKIPVPAPLPQVIRRRLAAFGRLKSPFRLLLSLLITPFLLLAAAISFVAVLADFCLFRISDRRNGHPQPKGLWEF